jgi:hypothetical protein
VNAARPFDALFIHWWMLALGSLIKSEDSPVATPNELRGKQRMGPEISDALIIEAMKDRRLLQGVRY